MRPFSSPRLLVTTLAAVLLTSSVAVAREPAPKQPAKAAQARKGAELSDALKVKRPEGGEWFGMYLMGKKVGHIYTDLSPVPGQPDKARSVNEFVFKANVGQSVSERRHREVRIYESKPNGRLLSFVVEQSGDGGDQVLEGTNTAQGLHLVRKRPGHPNDVRNLPSSPETIETADLARVALLRNKAIEAQITDGTDLETYKVSATVEKPETRTVNGVKLKLRRVTTISEKEKVPSITSFTPDGSTVEINLGETLRAVAEPEATAKRLDKVEVFGLTRVVLPSPLGNDRRQIPGEVKLRVTGLPDRFHQASYRQSYRKLQSGQVEVTIRAAFPSKENRKKLPLTDPSGGKYLESNLVVEADHPEIRALAKKLAGSETDAYTIARRINDWVHQNLVRDYGASADRASDVLRQKKGDCTEHALLASTLMRAVGIPARRVDGLVYLMNEDGVPALYWHEWVEAYVGEWTAMDPTFNQVVADATHLALGEEGGAEITPLIGQLKVHAVE